MLVLSVVFSCVFLKILLTLCRIIRLITLEADSAINSAFHLFTSAFFKHLLNHPFPQFSIFIQTAFLKMLGLEHRNKLKVDFALSIVKAQYIRKTKYTFKCELMDRDDSNLDSVENLSKESPVVIFDVYFEASSAFASWN